MDRRVTKILTSGGAAYNLDLGFKPNYIKIRNVTKWNNTSEVIETFWYEGMANASYKSIANQASLASGLIAGEDTTNGFTPYGAEAFSDHQQFIDTGASKVTKAANAVVTITGHGFVTGDKVTFNCVLDGMTELNGLRSTIKVLTADTFSCNDIDSTGFTVWDASEAGGQVIKIDEVDNEGFAGITLGTGVIGNSSDVLIVEAHWFDNFGTVSA